MVHKFEEMSRTNWMNDDGNIGNYIIRVVVEWDKAMYEIKNEGLSQLEPTWQDLWASEG